MSEDGVEIQAVLDTLLSDFQFNRMNPLPSSRVIYAVRLTKKQSNEKLLQNLIDQTVGEFAERDVKIAGLLIVQPWCYVHCIEAKNDDTEDFLTQVLHRLSSHSINQDSKLLCILDDIKLNLFTTHSSIFLNIKTQTQSPEPPEEPKALESIKEVHGLFELVSQLQESGLLETEKGKVITLSETSANIPALLSFEDLLRIDQYTSRVVSL